MKNSFTPRRAPLYKRVGSNCNSVLIQSNISTQFDTFSILKFLRLFPATDSMASSSLNFQNFDFKDMNVNQVLKMMKNKTETFNVETDSREAVCCSIQNINLLFIQREIAMEYWFPILKSFLNEGAKISCRTIIFYQKDLSLSNASSRGSITPYGISYLGILEDLTQLHLDLVERERIDGLSLCSLFLKKVSGRVERGEFEYYLDANGNAIVKETGGESSKSVTVQKEKTASSVAAATNLTFNLSLSESQKSQRESLVLPYTEAQVFEGDANVKDTVIHYIADKNDDFDSEDDPDDDLDL
jgi:hypothetical protein